MENVNTHLVERFGKKPVKGHQAPCQDDCVRPPLARTSQLVQQYCRPRSTPEDGWLSLPEFPSSAELLATSASEAPALRPNIISGSFDSPGHYLQTHYDLLRYDSVQPLRRTISNVREHPNYVEKDHLERSLGIYDRVQIKGVTFSTMGLAVRVCFSTARSGRQIKWEQSKRLMPNSLLALTPAKDMFQTMAIAVTVAARPFEGLEKSPPEIDLFFARPDELEIDPAIEWVLVEDRSAYFEADRHTMLALQKMMTESFPLQEHIVNVKPIVGTPDYLEARPPNSPLADAELYDTLDVSQQDALTRIISKQLAIIQGPPGTGKTHVSVAALRSILCRNDAGSGANPPIIVSCQTNHALDQILTHLSQFEPCFARLGSQSKDDAIKRRTLFNLRQQSAGGTPYSSNFRKAKKAAEGVQRRMESVMNPLKQGFGPLSHKVLSDYGIMSNQHADDLERSAAEWASSSTIPADLDVPIARWVGKHLSRIIPPRYTDMLNLPAEEIELEFEMLLEAEAENITKEEDELSLKGTYFAISDNYACKTSGEPLTDDSKIEQILAKCQDLGTLAHSLRQHVYAYYQRRLKKHLLPKIRALAIDYARHTAERRNSRFENDAAMLSSMNIIGLTTTGLSKYRALIHALQPRIVLIEEAAETKEAPVASACLPSLQHLILVGDHKQLRPQCHWRYLAGSPWYLDISMFERLMNNGVESTTLAVQRRMIPEIRRGIYPVYKNAVVDHDSVRDVTHRPPIPGMGNIRTFFYSSDAPEMLDENVSPFNPAEADMLVGLYNYLYTNGVQPQQITILTFYNGQRKVIMRKLAEHHYLRDISRKDFVVRTVDSYQGEENDIVLLSLVRSNSEINIGFLANQNRACVALSRAKRAMYIFGNAELLLARDQHAKKRDTARARILRQQAQEQGLASEPFEQPSYIWSEFLAIIAKRLPPESSAGIPLPAIPGTADGLCRAGKKFPIVCQRHKTTSFVSWPADWLENCGGCNRPCDVMLACGHACPLKCHPFEHDSEGRSCNELCTRILDCGHPCREICKEVCKCDVPKCLIAADQERRVKEADRKQQQQQQQQQRGQVTEWRRGIDYAAAARKPSAVGLDLQPPVIPDAKYSPRRRSPVKSIPRGSPVRHSQRIGRTPQRVRDDHGTVCPDLIDHGPVSSTTSIAPAPEPDGLLIPDLDSVSGDSVAGKPEAITGCLLDL